LNSQIERLWQGTLGVSRRSSGSWSNIGDPAPSSTSSRTVKDSYSSRIDGICSQKHPSHGISEKTLLRRREGKLPLLRSRARRGLNWPCFGPTIGMDEYTAALMAAQASQRQANQPSTSGGGHGQGGARGARGRGSWRGRGVRGAWRGGRGRSGGGRGGWDQGPQAPRGQHAVTGYLGASQASSTDHLAQFYADVLGGVWLHKRCRESSTKARSAGRRRRYLPQ